MSVRIVVPLDMSELSESALPLARALSSRRDYPLTLVHVVEMPADLASFIGNGSGNDELLEIEDERHSYLEDIATTFPGDPPEMAVLRGRPAAEIVRYVDALENPLIVMSSHGRTGFRRMVVGSVLARVVHAATCPVLVARISDPDSEVEIKVPEAIQRVLVPLDGSEFAEQALAAAVHVLGGQDIEFHLVRVPEAVVFPTGTMYGSASYESVELYMDAARNEAQEYLTAVVDKLQSHGHTASWQVYDGLTAESITTAAQDWGADLIAISSHGRTGFRRFIMGSVAERILHESPVPVMIVGPEGDEDEIE